MDHNRLVSMLASTSKIQAEPDSGTDLHHTPASLKEGVFSCPASYRIMRNVPPLPPSEKLPSIVNEPLRIHSNLPTTVTCPRCHQEVTTIPHPEIGRGTWLTCVAMLFVGCAFGCCLLPFFFNKTKDYHHDCPNCKRTIDVHKFI